MNEEDKVIQSRIFSLDECATVNSLFVKVRQKFAKDRLKLKYCDEVGDLVTICDEADLDAAYEAAIRNPTTMKLVLWCYDID
jgi:hypothetical protein